MELKEINHNFLNDANKAFTQHGASAFCVIGLRKNGEPDIFSRLPMADLVQGLKELIEYIEKNSEQMSVIPQENSAPNTSSTNTTIVN
jgi:hypothetical protein